MTSEELSPKFGSTESMNRRVVSRALIALLILGSCFCLLQGIRSGLVVSQSAQDVVPGLPIHDSGLGLIAKPATQDLGRMPTHARVHREVRFINPTDSEVVVDGIVASCGCAQVSPASFTLPAGGSQTVALDILASQARGRGTTPFSGMLSLRSGSKRSDFLLTGTTIDVVRLATSTVGFREPPRLGESAISEVATVFLEEEAQRVDVTSPAGGGEVVNLSEHTADGIRRLSFQVKVEAVETIPVLDVPLQIMVNVRDAELLTVQWNAMAVVKSDLGVHPRSLIVTGDAFSDACQLSVSSDSGMPLEELVVDANSLPVELKVLELDAPSLKVVQFRLAPDSIPGTVFGSVTLRGVSPVNSAPFRLLVPLTVRRSAASPTVAIAKDGRTTSSVSEQSMPSPLLPTDRTSGDPR